jgi:DNA replication protein DnaC
MLFQIISERSERASVIISTNLEFSQWTQLFENEVIFILSWRYSSLIESAIDNC